MYYLRSFPSGTSGKEPTCQCRRRKRHGFDPESGRAPGGGHSNPFQYSCLENPMTEETGGLWFIRLQRVGHDWRDLAHTTSMLNIIYWIPTNCQAFGGGLVAKSCPTLATPWTVACQAPPSIGFSRQEYWSGLPFPSPGDLPNPGIEPRSPALQADSLLTELWGKPKAFGSHWEIRDD